MKRYPSVLLAAVSVAVAIDLGTKWLAENLLVLHYPVSFFGEGLRFTLAYNEGVAFGLFATDGPGVIIMSGIATFLMAVWLIHGLRTKSYPLPGALVVGVLLGGAVANFLDRIVDGRVTDFIDVGLGAFRWATFNLADVFILFGITMLVMKSYEPKQEEEVPESENEVEQG